MNHISEEGGNEVDMEGGGCGGSSQELHRSTIENYISRCEYRRFDQEIIDLESARACTSDDDSSSVVGDGEFDGKRHLLSSEGISKGRGSRSGGEGFISDQIQTYMDYEHHQK